MTGCSKREGWPYPVNPAPYTRSQGWPARACAFTPCASPADAAPVTSAAPCFRKLRRPSAVSGASRFGAWPIDFFMRALPGGMRALLRFRMLGGKLLTRQARAGASASEVLLNGVLRGLLQETCSGGIDSRGVGIAHRRPLENRRIRRARRQISPDKARVPFVGLIELQVRASCDRLRKGEPRRNHQCVVVVAGEGVLLRQLLRHLGPVLVRPRHEKNRACAMGGHDLALLPRVSVEHRLELRMDGALAAVGDDHRIELPAGFVEDDLVISDE